MYLSIQYLRHNGLGVPAFDSYVIEMPSDLFTLELAVAAILKHGFRRLNTEHTSYDEQQWITPGAIMSITPCDERGYSDHFKAEVERQRKEGYR